MSLAEAARALATLAPADKAGQVVQLGNITVINDCYNSNPKALDAMVDALAAMPAKRRIVVAGEMLELGPSGEETASRVPDSTWRQKGIDILVGVRGLAQPMVDAASSAGMQGRIRGHARRSRRVAGPRNPRRRCGAAESIARSEAGTSFGNSRRSSVVSRQQIEDRDERLTADD